MKKSVCSSLLGLLLPLILLAQREAPINLRGFISDQDSGEPIYFATLILYRGTAPAAAIRADYEGRYCFTHLEPGAYRLTVASVGYDTLYIHDLNLPPIQNQYFDIQLKAKALLPEVPPWQLDPAGKLPVVQPIPPDHPPGHGDSGQQVPEQQCNFKDDGPVVTETIQRLPTKFGFFMEGKYIHIGSGAIGLTTFVIKAIQFQLFIQ